ncbi:MAG: flagellin-like protein [Sphingomonadaceae bacterium]|nr:flagellin-like protein [Sphingomonadaceae bacterium]
MINGTGSRMTQEATRQARLAAQIASKQAQISTGKRLQRASDDPAATARIADLNRTQTNDNARARNISLAISMTAQADGQLRNMSHLLARTRELTISGASTALTPSGRATLSREIRAMADEIDAMASVKFATGEALFANKAPNPIRFDDTIAFAPVPARQAIFETGGIAITQIMRDAASAIAAGDLMLTGAALTALNGAVNHAADAQAEIGVNAARLDRLQEFSAQRGITLSEELSTLGDTDLGAAIAELKTMTLTLEAAQGAFARINRRTLMELLA